MSKEAPARLPHGDNCQCLACRLDRFAKRGQAAQGAVDAALKKAQQAEQPPPKSHARVKR